MMKVAIVNAPWEEEGRWGIRSGCRFPNLMLKNHNAYVPFPFLMAYTASYLHEHGVDVLAIDGVAERCSKELFLQRLRDFAPDVLIAETATTSLAHDLQLLSRLVPDLPAMKIAVYGPHVSIRPDDAFASSCVHAVIIGEPEFTSLALVEAVENGTPWEGITGLAYRASDGSVRINPRRALIADLDQLPYPERRSLPMERYHVPGFPEPVVFMYGSRGCPFLCNFCLWPQTLFERGSYRRRSARSIAEEMAWVLEQYPGTKSIFFDDDTFHLGTKRMNEFADALEELRISIPWGCNARGDHWDRETLRRLRKNGLFTLRIGIESGDQDVLRTIGKGLDLEEARSLLRFSHSLGIQNHVSFVIGLQGESSATLDATMAFIRSVPVDSVQFSVAVPFPGTTYYEHVEKNDLFVTRDWTKFNGYDHVVMRTEHLSAEDIMRGLTSLRRKVYFSPRFIKKRLAYVRNLRDLGALSRKVLKLVLPH